MSYLFITTYQFFFPIEKKTVCNKVIKRLKNSPADDYYQYCQCWFLEYEAHTLKPWYNEPWYSEFCVIENKTELPFWGFTKHIIFDKVNYSI